ncbi:MAG: putative selenium-dependent hydroxylase accessory protein YqeC [Deltaproteobacteria bacterium]|nr:putative selenium-dependent hydroxylase accessory protein YqeC [Deltaproteobacteria bacterium]
MASLRESLMLQNGGVVSLVGAGGKTSLLFRIARELSANGETVLTTTTTKIFPPEKNQSQHVIIAETAEEVIRSAKELLGRHRHITAVSRKLSSENKLGGFPPETIDVLLTTGVFKWILVEADGAAGRPLKAPADYEPIIPQSSKWLVAVVGLNVIGKPLGINWVFRPDIYSEITGIKPGEEVTALSVANAITHERGIMKGCPKNAGRYVFLNQADSNGDIHKGASVAMLLKENGGVGLKRIIIGRALYDPPVIKYYDLP